MSVIVKLTDKNCHFLSTTSEILRLVESLENAFHCGFQKLPEISHFLIFDTGDFIVALLKNLLK